MNDAGETFFIALDHGFGVNVFQSRTEDPEQLLKLIFLPNMWQPL